MEKYTIRKYTKIFTDRNKQYWFDVPMYMKMISDNNLSAEEITAKIELVVEDSGRLKSSRTIGRVREYSEGADISIKTDTIKMLGAALVGDEYAFLEEVDARYLARVMQKMSDIDIADVDGKIQ